MAPPKKPSIHDAPITMEDVDDSVYVVRLLIASQSEIVINLPEIAPKSGESEGGLNKNLQRINQRSSLNIRGTRVGASRVTKKSATTTASKKQTATTASSKQTATTASSQQAAILKHRQLPTPIAKRALTNSSKIDHEAIARELNRPPVSEQPHGSEEFVADDDQDMTEELEEPEDGDNFVEPLIDDGHAGPGGNPDRRNDGGGPGSAGFMLPDSNVQGVGA